MEASDAALSARKPASLGQAVLINLFNPGPYLYWSLIATPLLIEGWRRSPADAILFLVGFYGVMVTVLAGELMIFDGAGRFGETARRRLRLFSALIMAGIGCSLIFQMF